MKAVKSHHNVGGLPEDLDFALVEPLKMLFKDEVRACGKALGLPDSMVYRQPFPGPGLGVRCLGAITRDRLEAVRESDAILREEFAKAGLEGKVWQYFTVVPDFKSVGVHEGSYLRLAGHSACGKYRGCNDRHGGGCAVCVAAENHTAHHIRSERCEPCPLRPDTEALRDD